MQPEGRSGDGDHPLYRAARSLCYRGVEPVPHMSSESSGKRLQGATISQPIAIIRSIGMRAFSMISGSSVTS